MPTHYQSRIPTSHNATYEKLMSRYENDRSGMIGAALDALAAVEFPPSTWGFVKIVPGDIDIYRPELGDDPERAAQCPDCGEPLEKETTWLAFHSDNTFSLTCAECVKDYN